MKRPRTVVHAITVVQTMLQVVDAHGNVTEQVPLEQRIKILNAREFAQAFAAVDKARQRLIQGLPAVEAPALPVSSKRKGR